MRCTNFEIRGDSVDLSRRAFAAAGVGCVAGLCVPGSQAESDSRLPFAWVAMRTIITTTGRTCHWPRVYLESERHDFFDGVSLQSDLSAREIAMKEYEKMEKEIPTCIGKTVGRKCFAVYLHGE